MSHSVDLLTAARAEALFTSDISASSQPSPVDVATAIRQAVRRYGGTRGCAAEVAAAYGDRPETAAPRMRWARSVVETVYTRAVLDGKIVESDRCAEKTVSVKGKVSTRTTGTQHADVDESRGDVSARAIRML